MAQDKVTSFGTNRVSHDKLNSFLTPQRKLHTASNARGAQYDNGDNGGLNNYLHRGGGQMFSKLAFYSSDLSSNPTENHILII